MKLSKEMQGRILSAPVFIRNVEGKILAGEYLFEEAPCACGSSEEIELSKVDRDRLPHRLVVCKQCALVRANPRLTRESSRKYFNAEFPEINIGRILVPNMDERVYLNVDEAKSGFEAQYISGETLLKWLDDADVLVPEKVIHLECRYGGVLAAFQAAGCEVWGTEANEAMRSHVYQPTWVYPDIDELVALGVKADLVIMQESLDHLTDLAELKIIHSLLKPGGLLYVQTPGFFSKDPNKTVRLGRNYHFCQATLVHTLSLFDFEEVYADEEINALFRLRGSDNFIFYPHKPSEWVGYTLDYLHKPDGEDRRIPRFRGQCKFTKKLLYSNIRANLKHGIPDIAEISHTRSGGVVIVGGGPSVDGQLENIKALKKDGLPVMAIARMYPWLLRNGVVPDYCISLDCSEEQESSFETLHKDTTFLIASVSRPKIVSAIASMGYRGFVFDSEDSDKVKHIRLDAGYKVATVINPAGTVVITAFTLGMNLGFTDYHIFGLDLMVSDQNQTHAKGIAGKSVDFDFVNVMINGEEILTTLSFMDFANQALDIISGGHDQGLMKSIKFYGDSLINRMWDGQWHEEEGTDVQPNT